MELTHNHWYFCVYIYMLLYGMNVACTPAASSQALSDNNLYMGSNIYIYIYVYVVCVGVSRVRSRAGISTVKSIRAYLYERAPNWTKLLRCWWWWCGGLLGGWWVPALMPWTWPSGCVRTGPWCASCAAMSNSWTTCFSPANKKLGELSQVADCIGAGRSSKKGQSKMYRSQVMDDQTDREREGYSNAN